MTFCNARRAKYRILVMHEVSLISQKRAGITILRRQKIPPLELNTKIRAVEENTLPDPTHYQHVFGCLVYLIITFSDILFVITYSKQFVSIHFRSLFIGLFFNKGVAMKEKVTSIRTQAISCSSKLSCFMAGAQSFYFLNIISPIFLVHIRQ